MSSCLVAYILGKIIWEKPISKPGKSFMKWLKNGSLRTAGSVRESGIDKTTVENAVADDIRR
jgi:hypothetical protein